MPEALPGHSRGERRARAGCIPRRLPEPDSRAGRSDRRRHDDYRPVLGEVQLQRTPRLVRLVVLAGRARSTKDVVQRSVREVADQPWHAKNYAKVRELYESIHDDLSIVERKRLEYAEKHCRACGPSPREIEARTRVGCRQARIKRAAADSPPTLDSC